MFHWLWHLFSNISSAHFERMADYLQIRQKMKQNNSYLVDTMMGRKSKQLKE